MTRDEEAFDDEGVTAFPNDLAERASSSPSSSEHGRAVFSIPFFQDWRCFVIEWALFLLSLFFLRRGLISCTFSF